MDDITKNIGKVLGGLNGAQGLLHQFITPEIKKEMTQEQLDQLDEAIKVSSPEALKKMANDLMNTAKKM